MLAVCLLLGGSPADSTSASSDNDDLNVLHAELETAQAQSAVAEAVLKLAQAKEKIVKVSHYVPAVSPGDVEAPKPSIVASTPSSNAVQTLEVEQREETAEGKGAVEPQTKLKVAADQQLERKSRCSGTGCLELEGMTGPKSDTALIEANDEAKARASAKEEPGGYRKLVNAACPRSEDSKYFTVSSGNPSSSTADKKPTVKYMVIESGGTSSERYVALSKNMKEHGIAPPEIVPAVMGAEMDQDEYAKSYFGKHGVKDNFIEQFPHLIKDGHHGTKGLMMSTLRFLDMVLEEPKEKRPDWILLFESDAYVPKETGDLSEMTVQIAQQAQEDVGMVWLDPRSGSSHCCMSGTMFRVRDVPKLREAMDIYGERFQEDRGEPNLHDFFVHSLCSGGLVGCEFCGLVESGGFKSEISNGETPGKSEISNKKGEADDKNGETDDKKGEPDGKAQMTVKTLYA